MNINDLLNEKVTHTVFGSGIIEKTTEKYIDVFFPEKNKTSIFSYPTCFRTFLTIDNECLKPEIDKDLQEWLVTSGTLDKEKRRDITIKRQQAIENRVKERERLRIEKAKSLNRTRPQPKTDK